MLYCICRQGCAGQFPPGAQSPGSKHLERLRKRWSTRAVSSSLGHCPPSIRPIPGPAGFSGSITVAEFASLEDARAWAESDPYVDAGVYESVDVYPFKQVFP